ncbi:hypothetical protein CRG98_020989 [Punica granatum]|uniref:Uncharacterized protein n=1 Tax=Punica granatum TaxID=22663 RepID=A0A2I0JRT7_PUNGR|nr:hypothetical protein CRG98_020989 [Punica granatum]
MLGGDAVLLAFESHDHMGSLIMDPGWLRQWFYHIKEWEPGLGPTESSVWLRSEGVPPLAWTAQFFSVLCSLHGRFVSFDHSTLTKERLDLGRPHVTTIRREFIMRNVKVDIDGQAFDIRKKEVAPVPPLENSISDGGIQNMNRIIKLVDVPGVDVEVGVSSPIDVSMDATSDSHGQIAANEVEVEKTWEIVKAVGLASLGDESAVLKKISRMIGREEEEWQLAS